MYKQQIKLSPIKWLSLTIFIIIFLNTTVFFNIPVLKPIVGFIFLTCVPGFLILLILKLQRLPLTEKIILSVGLSISFTMFFGLAVNSLLFAIGYTRPLTLVPLLISFSAAAIILAFIAYRRNRDISITFSGIRLSTREKVLLVIPAIFPLLSIIGTRVMNLTDNNILIMVLLLMIPAYVIFISFHRRRVPQLMYPWLISLISISLLLILALRSNHILGSDVHDMYYFFQLTFQEGHWRLFSGGLVDTTLSITILPTVYQSFMSINPEFLFKILFPVLFSISPLVVYVITRKYIGSFYAFLASFFFMSQVIFLNTSGGSSTNMAILFVALSIMVLFLDTISEFTKKLLFIIFAFSLILSHYSTSYIFFFMLLFTWLGMEIIPRISIRGRKIVTTPENHRAGNGPGNSFPDSSPPENNIELSGAIDTKTPPSRLQKGITPTLVALFFVFVFFWYGQITGTPFEIGVGVIYDTLLNLNNWYLLEAKGATIGAAMGQNILTIPQQIRVIVSWLTVAFIGVGVLGAIVRYKKTVEIPGSGGIKEDFLQSKFEMTFMMLAISCSAILVLSMVLPIIMAAYSMERTYFQMMIVLSPFFIIGGIMMTKLLKVRPHWLILSVLVPFFLFTTGAMYQVLGYPASLTLNSEGAEYETWYLHDQDSDAAKWLKAYGKEQDIIYTYTWPGPRVLKSQAGITSGISMPSPGDSVSEGEKTNGYIYLRHNDVINNKMPTRYPELFATRDKIYTTGSSEVYR